MKCRICGSGRHFDLLHLSSAEKKERAKEAGTVNDSQDNVNAKYTLVCKGTPVDFPAAKVYRSISTEKITRRRP